MNCILCGSVVGSANPEKYPYCSGCHWSGRGYAHRWSELLEGIHKGGFDATIWQTGGGCMNLAIGLTEAGLSGPHMLGGMAAFDNLSDWEWGVMISAHREKWIRDDGTEAFDWEWVGNAPGCDACERLYALEEEMNTTYESEFTNPAEAAAFTVTQAKRVAAMVHAQINNHKEP